MLHLILGAKGAGKTTELHRRLAAYVRDEGAAALLLVPRQFTFESDKGILDMLGPKDACNVQVLSFSRLSDAVFKRAGKPKQPLLKEGANTAIMLLTLEGIRDRLTYFARHCGNLGFAKKLLRQIADYKQNCITPDDLRAAALETEPGFLKTKLEETALIFDAYNAMVAQSFFDDQDVLTLTAEKLPESGLFDGKIIAVDGFSVFSNQELFILREALLRGREVYVSLCTADENAHGALSPFALTDGTLRQLRRLAAQCGVPVAAPVVCGANPRTSDALRVLERELYAPVQRPFAGDADAVSLRFAPSLREECDFAALQIHALLREGRYRCRDIAVVYRDGNAYADEIKHSFQTYGVPVFEDHRAPVANEPLILLVRSLLSMAAGGFTTEVLMRYLKTGLSGVTWDEIAEVENYALMWDISAAGWQQEWLENPDGFGVEMNDERRTRLAALNALRARIMTPLSAFRTQVKNAAAKEIMRAVYFYLTEHQIDAALKAYAISLEEAGELDLALSQEQVWDCLMTVLDDVAQTLGDRVIAPAQLLEVFDAVVAAQSLGKLPDGYDEVDLCDASRIATQTPKVVFVLGMNAGVFPQSPNADGLFSHTETAALREKLPTLRDDEMQSAQTERFLVYNALCSARERLFVSWSLTGTAGEKLTESEIVLQLKTLFPACAAVGFDTLTPEERCESTQPAFEWMAKTFRSRSPKTAALQAYFAADKAFGARLRTLERAVDKRSFAFADMHKAKTLFGKRLELSASQLETYEECPFQYFCRYGLRASPRKIAKLDPANSGTIVHFVLEHLLRAHAGETFKTLSPAQAQTEIRDLLRVYMDTYMGGTQGKGKRFLYLYDRLEKTLVTIVERLLCEFSFSDFVPVGFEVKIGANAEVQPYKIPLKDGEISLRGVIDRVDRMDANGNRYIRVVDYKTGTKEFALSDVLGGLSMQMLLYLVALWRDGSGDYENMIPAGVLYLPARAEPFDAARSDDADVIQARRMAGGQMEGMILDDGVVLKGMDHSLSGTFLPVTANRRTKALSGRFISLEQLGRLAKRMDAIMADMGNALHRGQVPARPVTGKTHGKTCEWCDYASVCGHTRDGDYRYLPFRSHTECLEELEKEEG